MRLFRLAKQYFCWLAIFQLSFLSLVQEGNAQGVENCRPNDTRTAIPVWKPNLANSGMLVSKPPTTDGQIVFIKASVDASVLDCAGAPEDRLYTLSVPDPRGSAEYGGLAVNFRGNVQFANGTCYISGFFMNEDVFGMHQGWIETYFGPVKKLDIVMSGRFCLK